MPKKKEVRCVTCLEYCQVSFEDKIVQELQLGPGSICVSCLKSGTFFRQGWMFSSFENLRKDYPNHVEENQKKFNKRVMYKRLAYHGLLYPFKVDSSRKPTFISKNESTVEENDTESDEPQPEITTMQPTKVQKQK